MIDWRTLLFFSTGFAVIALLDALRSLKTKDKKRERTFTLTIIGYLVTFQFMIDVLPNTYFPILVIILGSIHIIGFLLIAFLKDKIDIWIIPLLKYSEQTIVTIVLWGLGVLLAYLQLYLAWWILVFIVLTWVIIIVVREQTKKKSSKSNIGKQEQNSSKDDNPKREI